MSRWFRFAARGRTGSSCLAIGARPGLVVEDLDLFLKLVPLETLPFEKSRKAPNVKVSLKPALTPPVTEQDDRR